MITVYKMHAIISQALALGIAVALTMLLAGRLSAQPPLGAGNEVWVDVPDTVYVGQEVELPVYIANSSALGAFELRMKIVSLEGAQWDWVYHPDTEGISPNDSVMVSLKHDSRFWGDNLEVPGAWWEEPCGEDICPIGVGGVSFAPPDAPSGPLEWAYTVHIRPTSPGTIAVDSAQSQPASSQWYLLLAGEGFVYPEWNGPFTITVVDAPKGDVNCDGAGNLGDAVYIINWIFKGGPDPCR